MEKLAWRPVTAIAGATTVLLLATSTRFGYHGDELYFLAAGHHPAWSYADQPPLLPLIARATDAIAPGSLIALRLPATLATTIGIVLTAMTARELGGPTRAQTIAAATYAVSPFILQTGHLLLTSTLDVFWWTLLSWLLIRWIRTRQDSLLLWLGVVTALDLQTKYLVVLFWVAVAIGITISGPRELLTRPLLWAGAAIAVLATTPSLIWQAHNGWPQIAMSDVIATQNSDQLGTRLMLLALMVAVAGLAGTVLFAYGSWQLLRDKEYRFLGIAAVLVTVTVLAIGGTPYYIAGVFAPAWAAAAVHLGKHKATWPIYILSAALAVWVLPIYPVQWLRGSSLVVNVSLDEVGWTTLADRVATIYQGIPQNERANVAILTESEWLAAAIDRYGPERGLPTAYSGHRGYWWFGRPADDVSTVIYLGGTENSLRTIFTDVRRVGTVDNGLDVENEVQGKAIWICTGPRQPWSQLWPGLRHLTTGAL